MEDPKNGQPPQSGDPTGQPSGDQQGQGTAQMITLSSGQQKTPEELVKMFEDTQSEIGRLKNEIGKRNKSGGTAPAETDELKELEDIATLLMPILEKKGLARSEQLNALQNGQELERFVSSNPALVNQKALLETLKSSHPDLSFHEIAAKYKLTSGSDNAAAPSGDVVGNPNRNNGTANAPLDMNDHSKTLEAVRNVNSLEELESFRGRAGVTGFKKLTRTAAGM